MHYNLYFGSQVCNNKKHKTKHIVYTNKNRPGINYYILKHIKSKQLSFSSFSAD